MGKKGNQRRKANKPQGSLPLEEQIKKALAEGDEMAEREYISSLENLYGKRGPPEGVSNVLIMPPPKRKVVDCLGRVREVDDDITVPPTLRNFMYKNKHIGRRSVTLQRDHGLVYPDLFLSIFVAPDPDVRDDEARFAKMFVRAGCKQAKSPSEADLVVFAGGSDVDPVYYHEERHSSTFPDAERDEKDVALYHLCYENGIPMMGVCRGAQFLWVMNGGKLYQDVDNHVGDHAIYDTKRQKFIDKVSSVHHQMCRTTPGMAAVELLATCNIARNRSANPKERHIGPRADIEAFFVPETCCFGVQGHPEYELYPYFTKWVLEYLEELVITNPDVDWVGTTRRLKADILGMRDLGKLAKPKPDIRVEDDGPNAELYAAINAGVK